MALTAEVLTANEVLNGLSEEQISTIVTLSHNDEGVVIGKRIGEIYREMDSTIAEATGIARDGDEKTYNYLKRATEDFASKYKDYDTIKSEVDALKGENTELKEKIAKGGDDALRAELESTKRELASVKSEFVNVKESAEKEKELSRKALNDYKIGCELTSAKVGIKFKASFGEVALNALMAQAEKNVLGMNPTFEEREGKSVLIFHDKDNNPLLNANNKLEPYTTKELLLKEYETLGILETRKSKGAGGNGEGGQETHTLGEARTQVEAESFICKALAEKGIVKTSPKFTEEHDKMWRENNVSSLPLK